ncbi:MAG: GH116 family glycosyl hydrolase [Opitutaceae bacterium]|jgi:uncharacterized protein (DUF608 family)
MNPAEPLFPFRYRDDLQVALPIGGIGAGCLCLNGSGGLQDFSLRNRPSTTAVPDHLPYGCQNAAFALLHIKGDKPVTRLIEGPIPPEKIYDQGLQTQGFRHGGHEGLPRFSKSSFSAGYPFGRVQLSDPKVPVTAEVTGFNPFIPLDAKNSGIPCAVLEYTLKNTSRREVSLEFSFHWSHPAVNIGDGEQAARNAGERESRTAVVDGRGVKFFNTSVPTAEQFGTACLLAPKGKPLVKAMWFRGGWFDSISQLWREVSTGSFTPNDGWDGIDTDERNGGSILLRARLKPGQSITHPVILSWHFPNGYQAQAHGEMGWANGRDRTDGPWWRPYYAGVWADAVEVAQYVADNYRSLRERTVAFNRALFSSTLPMPVLDAVSANLAIIKSPTVLRLEGGQLWGWEGCYPGWGCCPGSCTHVWNYAQSIPHLFPELERTLRSLEWERSMDASGKVAFRAALPIGPARFKHCAAADGQLGGMLKLYRDWHISGDTPWMAGLYPLARLSLEYAIETWDPERTGLLVEPHHNTYDIEFWGPDGMCTSIYIAALSAMARLAAALGRSKDEQAYAALAERGAKAMAAELFNGEYLQQRVRYADLRDKSFLQELEARLAKGGQRAALLKNEGPKYQYGSGCLSDGVIGAWMARIYGVEAPFDQSQIRSTLSAIHRHNFRSDLAEHANCQRPGYALGHEAGLLLCSWPRGEKPTLPFVYSDEVWTGIEYQVATHLIAEGMVKEGLALVKAVRSRYDGRVRNPFNEYECGGYYARAMASYALLGTLSGFRYSAVERTLWFGPKLRTLPFQVFFSAAEGWGTVRLEKDRLVVSLVEGRLPLKRILVETAGTVRELVVDKVVKAGSPVSFRLGATRRPR